MKVSHLLIGLALAVLLLFPLGGCDSAAPTFSNIAEETEEQILQYNAAAEYRNLVEQTVRGELAGYASCFGLGDAPVLLQASPSFSMRFDPDTQLKELSTKMNDCYAQIYDTTLAHAIVEADKTGRFLLEKFPAVVGLFENDSPSVESFSVQKLHQALMTGLDSYLAAVKNLDALLRQEETVLNQKELAFSVENQLVLRQSIQEFALACEQALSALQTGTPESIQLALPTAEAALAQFQESRLDEKQAAREGYPSDILESLSLAGEQLTQVFRACFAGTLEPDAAVTAYGEFVAYYNTVLTKGGL